LLGEKLRGGFTLVQMAKRSVNSSRGDYWLLVKSRDEHAARTRKTCCNTGLDHRVDKRLPVSGRLWREAVIPNTGCYEIEMISRFCPDANTGNSWARCVRREIKNIFGLPVTKGSVI
jgi:hypothetical protein